MPNPTPARMAAARAASRRARARPSRSAKDAPAPDGLDDLDAPEWTVVEHHVRTAGDTPMDLHIRVAMDHDGKPMSPGEARKAAWAALKAWMKDGETEWDRAQLTVPKRRVQDGPVHLPVERRPERPARFTWRKPDLPPEDLAMCHEILEGLLLLGVHGRAVTIGDLQKKRKIPQARLYAILTADSATYHYLEPYMSDLRQKGKRLLDLTDQGRLLASKIRAGGLPQ